MMLLISSWEMGEEDVVMDIDMLIIADGVKKAHKKTNVCASTKT